MKPKFFPGVYSFLFAVGASVSVNFHAYGAAVFLGFGTIFALVEEVAHYWRDNK